MTNQPTYLFYDIETTGLNKCFDQVLQFAAIRTDLNFNEIERIELKARINPDVTPAPAAVITHRIGPKQFTEGLSELAVIKQIHDLMNTPGTISLGYNTLGFDDEFLRFSFHKNLLPPYTHQYANNCGRMDIYPITLMFALFKPDLLKWPKKDDGSVSLKLENINAMNHFATGQAHDAMVDVEVTLELAKRLAQDENMWTYTTQYFKKPVDEQRIIQADTHTYIGNKAYKTGFMALGKLGAKNNFIAPVIQCGQHKHYKNQSIWLRLDTEQFSKENYPIKKRLAEPPLFLPLKDRYLTLLSIKRQQQLKNNLAWLNKNADQFFDIAAHHQHEKYPEITGIDIDAALYTLPFATPEETRLCKQFHRANENEKANITQQLPNSKREQAIRILGRHYPHLLSDNEQLQFDAYLKSERIDFRGEAQLTKAKALDDIAALEATEELDNEQRHLLMDLKAYLS